MTLRKKYAIRERIPANCQDWRTHKWKSSDTLAKVAKSYQIKDPNLIWDKKINGAVIKKRGKPENLQAGDVVNIPISKEAAKKWEAQVKKYNTTRDAYAKYADTLEAEIAELEKKIAVLDTQVTKIVRAQYDSRKERKAIDAMLSVVIPVEGLLGSVNTNAVPFGVLKSMNVKNYTKALKDHRMWMKGGKIDEEKLKQLEKLIAKMRGEIAALKKEIADLDKKLDKLGAETITMLCVHPSLQGFANIQLGLFNKAVGK